MSRSTRRRSRGGPGFPRVSGDEPDDWRELAVETAFSPRERG